MLQIQVQSVAAGDFTLRVVDAQGRLMLSRKYGVIAGPQTLTLPVQNLAKGWYVMVMVQADGTMREVKIVKE
jgi:N6-adenosine-specific RNA methylase IME4